MSKKFMITRLLIIRYAYLMRRKFRDWSSSFFKPELFVCSDIRESRSNLGMDSLVVFIKADSLEKE